MAGRLANVKFGRAWHVVAGSSLITASTRSKSAGRDNTRRRSYRRFIFGHTKSQGKSAERYGSDTSGAEQDGEKALATHTQSSARWFCPCCPGSPLILSCRCKDGEQIKGARGSDPCEEIGAKAAMLVESVTVIRALGASHARVVPVVAADCKCCLCDVAILKFFLCDHGHLAP